MWIYLLAAAVLLVALLRYLGRIWTGCPALKGAAGSITVETGDKVFYVQPTDRELAEALATALVDFNYFTGDRETFVKIAGGDQALDVQFVLNDVMLSAKGLDNIYGNLVAEKVRDTFPGRGGRITVSDYQGRPRHVFDIRPS